ncbi:MAG TPA: hypothetical protein VK964_01495 [Nocardioidaceae bacterium]|nr:hypothetical protein [Nocardioidaceae bacterium]
MKLSLGRSLTTLAVAAGLTLAAAGPAVAQSHTHLDARGDVTAYSMQTEEEAPAPNVKNGDIVRTALHHRQHRIAVRIKFVDLRRVGFRGDGIRVVTNEGVRREVTTFASPGMWRGEAEMMRPNGNPVDCDIKLGMDYDKNVVTVSFPRKCVSDPRWVRIGVGSFWAQMEAEKAFMDDAQRDGKVYENLRLSPRLKRG